MLATSIGVAGPVTLSLTILSAHPVAVAIVIAPIVRNVIADPLILVLVKNGYARAPQTGRWTCRWTTAIRQVLVPFPTDGISPRTICIMLPPKPDIGPFRVSSVGQ